MTKYEHCQKCGKQIEYFLNGWKNIGYKNVHDDKQSQMNRLEASRRSLGCTVYTFMYCDGCWYEMELLLQGKGFLPKGWHGFEKGDEDIE